MKNKILIILSSLIFSGVVIYGALAFATATFNPSEMNDFIRCMAAVIWLATIIPIVGINIDIEDKEF